LPSLTMPSSSTQDSLTWCWKYRSAASTPGAETSRPRTLAMPSGVSSAGCSRRLSAWANRLLIGSLLLGRENLLDRHETAMLLNRHARACVLQQLRIHFPADHALTLGQAGLDLAPGIYQTAVAPGFPPVGPGPQQHLPVGSSGDGGECRGYHYKLGTLVAQRQVELGKAHIVTDGQAQPPDRCIHADHPVAVAVVAGLAVAALVVRHLHIEQ